MSKEIIEINGIKLEIDTRQAKRVDLIAVGTRVKVLSRSYDTSPWEVLHGIVIGFEPFEALPTIIVACAKIEYQSAKVEFVYYNSDSKNKQLVVAGDDDNADLDKNQFVNNVDAEIAKKQAEVLELQQRKQFFLEKFACYWSPVDAGEPEEQE